jgi:hypothetical protein
VGDLDLRHRRRDRAVVEQPQIVVPLRLQQPVCLADVDQAAEEVRVLTARVPGLVVLQPSREAFEEQSRDAPRLDLLEDRRALGRAQVAGQKRRRAVDDHGAAGLVDVGGLPDQPRVLHHLRLTAPRHDHHLDPGAVAGLKSPRLKQREAALGVPEQRAARAEQRAVEVGVDASKTHRRPLP